MSTTINAEGNARILDPSKFDCIENIDDLRAGDLVVLTNGHHYPLRWSPMSFGFGGYIPVYAEEDYDHTELYVPESMFDYALRDKEATQ